MLIRSIAGKRLEERIKREKFNINDSVDKIQNPILRELLEFRIEGESQTYLLGNNITREETVSGIHVARFVYRNGLWVYIINLEVHRFNDELEKDGITPTTEFFSGSKCIKHRGIINWLEYFKGDSCNTDKIPMQDTKKAVKEILLKATLKDPFVLQTLEEGEFKHTVNLRKCSISDFDYTRLFEKNEILAHTCNYRGGFIED